MINYQSAQRKRLFNRLGRHNQQLLHSTSWLSTNKYPTTVDFPPVMLFSRNMGTVVFTLLRTNFSAVVRFRYRSHKFLSRKPATYLQVILRWVRKQIDDRENRSLTSNYHVRMRSSSYPTSRSAGLHALLIIGGGPQQHTTESSPAGGIRRRHLSASIKPVS